MGSFELVANAIKELGLIHSNCNGCPEDKVWNYFFDILAQQHAPDKFPVDARPRVEANRKMKEDMLSELREKVAKNKPVEDFIEILSRKVATTKVKMVRAISKSDKSESARIDDMRKVFEFTLRQYSGETTPMSLRPPAMEDWEKAPLRPDFRTWFSKLNIFNKYGQKGAEDQIKKRKEYEDAQKQKLKEKEEALKKKMEQKVAEDRMKMLKDTSKVEEEKKRRERSGGGEKNR